MVEKRTPRALELETTRMLFTLMTYLPSMQLESWTSTNCAALKTTWKTKLYSTNRKSAGECVQGRNSNLDIQRWVSSRGRRRPGTVQVSTHEASNFA